MENVVFFHWSIFRVCFSSVLSRSKYCVRSKIHGNYPAKCKVTTLTHEPGQEFKTKQVQDFSNLATCLFIVHCCWWSFWRCLPLRIRLLTVTRIHNFGIHVLSPGASWKHCFSGPPSLHLSDRRSSVINRPVSASELIHVLVVTGDRSLSDDARSSTNQSRGQRVLAREFKKISGRNFGYHTSSLCRTFFLISGLNRIIFAWMFMIWRVCTKSREYLCLGTGFLGGPICSVAELRMTRADGRRTVYHRAILCTIETCPEQFRAVLGSVIFVWLGRSSCCSGVLACLCTDVAHVVFLTWT